MLGSEKFAEFTPPTSKTVANIARSWRIRRDNEEIHPFPLRPTLFEIEI